MYIYSKNISTYIRTYRLAVLHRCIIYTSYEANKDNKNIITLLDKYNVYV